MDGYIFAPGRICKGHRVASGSDESERYPGGTIAMQRPFFGREGIDLDGFYNGTLNVDLAPLACKPVKSKYTVHNLRWCSEPAETFSFFDCILRVNGTSVKGLVYYPHPETKPAHEQPPTVVEILAPWVEGVSYGDKVEVGLLPSQMETHLV